VVDPFSLPFVQRGLAEVLVLALAAGLLGTWIVLRGLAFFAHAVGTAAFPGLVLAAGLGFSALLGAFVRGKVHVHFRDIADCRRELELAGFTRTDVLRPEELTEITGPIDIASSRRVRIIEAWTGAAPD